MLPCFILVEEDNSFPASFVSTDLFTGDMTLSLQRIAVIQNCVDFYHDSMHEMQPMLLVFGFLLCLADSMNFDSLQIYDVADLLKLYFRELPECLLTRPLSQVFISIFRSK